MLLSFMSIYSCVEENWLLQRVDFGDLMHMCWCGLLGFEMLISSWFSIIFVMLWGDLVELWGPVCGLLFQCSMLQNCGIWFILLQNYYILSCRFWRVFGTFMCVLWSDGSWFGASQVYLLVCQLVFLSSSDSVNDEYYYLSCCGGIHIVCWCSLIMCYAFWWSGLIVVHVNEDLIGPMLLRVMRHIRWCSVLWMILVNYLVV